MQIFLYVFPAFLFLNTLKLYFRSFNIHHITNNVQWKKLLYWKHMLQWYYN